MSSPSYTPVGPASHAVFYPLTEFYRRQDLSFPLLEKVSSDTIPEPQHALLVHEDDMTPTLERFYRDDIYIQALHSEHSKTTYYREVVLFLNGDHRPVEFGAICIDLKRLPKEVASVILQEHLPLGHILADYKVEHLSRPQAFLRMKPDSLTDHAFGAQPVEWLYGRRNRLLTPQGESLAEIVEILPFT